MGFAHDYNFKDKDIEYDVYKKGPIDLTICHTSKTVNILISMDDEIQIKSLNQLQQLTKIINA